ARRTVLRPSAARRPSPPRRAARLRICATALPTAPSRSLHCLLVSKLLEQLGMRLRERCCDGSLADVEQGCDLRVRKVREAAEVDAEPAPRRETAHRLRELGIALCPRHGRCLDELVERELPPVLCP